MSLGTCEGICLHSPHMGQLEETDKIVGHKSQPRKVSTRPNWILPSHHNLPPSQLDHSATTSLSSISVTLTMGISTLVQNTPREIQYGMLHHIVRNPRVNFVKLSGVFNGGHQNLWERPHGFDPAQQGVEEVSPLSGSHKLAKVLMEISPGTYSPIGFGEGVEMVAPPPPHDPSGPRLD